MPVVPEHKVMVVGSVNQDIILSVPALPQAGETVLAVSSRVATGGKGANQAVAAARFGASTVFVGSVGSDAASGELRTALEGEGVQVHTYQGSLQPSGQAVVLVDETGENCIVVAQGANADLPASYVFDCLEDLEAGDVLVIQGEVAQEAIEAALVAGDAADSLVILNLAPFRELREEALTKANLIVVNEGEAASLAKSGPPLSDPAAVAEHIAQTYGCWCVITLGGRGSLVTQGASTVAVPAMQVPVVVDTTGAGDAFVGVLAARLAEGDDLLMSVRTATAVAARTVMSLGAQSFPTLQELSESFAGPAA
ncbi:ribokinase [Pseudarthrobacter phenanthrenivorans]|uniref:ribokinase n=1 Tax=Pseudarthrobacter phenanthrenivorans TaxID=361575 RepID=UPI002F34F9E5